MAYEGWYICDVCGKRVSRDDEGGLKPWIDINIDSHYHWGKDAKPFLDADVCGKACAIKAVRDWLEGA